MPAIISAATDSTPSPPPPPPPPPLVYTIVGLSTPLTLGLTAGFVIFLITLFLALFLCYHLTLNPRSRNPNPNPNPSNDQAIAAVQQHRGVPGLEEVVISSYPKFSFSVNGGGEGLCSICLNEYKEGQMLRRMPECRHSFHIWCVDNWLRRHGTCPVCRSAPAPASFSAPMADLLSPPQDSGDRVRG